MIERITTPEDEANNQTIEAKNGVENCCEAATLTGQLVEDGGDATFVLHKGTGLVAPCAKGGVSPETNRITNPECTSALQKSKDSPSSWMPPCAHVVQLTGSERAGGEITRNTTIPECLLRVIKHVWEFRCFSRFVSCYVEPFFFCRRASSTLKARRTGTGRRRTMGAMLKAPPRGATGCLRKRHAYRDVLAIILFCVSTVSKKQKQFKGIDEHMTKELTEFAATHIDKSRSFAIRVKVRGVDWRIYLVLHSAHSSRCASRRDSTTNPEPHRQQEANKATFFSLFVRPSLFVKVSSQHASVCGRLQSLTCVHERCSWRKQS